MFLHFFEIFIFWAVRGVKGQKIVQNEKQELHQELKKQELKRTKNRNEK